MRISDWSSDVCSSDLKARAEREKAARKTEQPQELIAGIEYRKLVVARKQAERKLALARELESANVEQRAQELRLVRSEIAQLTADVARFGKAQADLTISAPRSGILMHRSSWTGDKFRSDKRRGGKECVGTCRSRWAATYKKK